MDKSFFFKAFALYVVFSSLLVGCGENRPPFNPQQIIQERQDKELVFMNAESSPLTLDQRKSDKYPKYFEPKEEYIVKAVLVPAATKDTILFPTTQDSVQKSFKNMGKLVFALDGSQRELKAFLPIHDHEKGEADHDHFLFVPFTDDSNGEESYEGGRYIDIKLEKGFEYILDFNMAYNPYCAYNQNYSCPIVPKENHLSTRILAGEKNYK